LFRPPLRDKARARIRDDAEKTNEVMNDNPTRKCSVISENEMIQQISDGGD